MPLLKPPAPWTGRVKIITDDGFRASFVRAWQPEIKAAIEAAFLDSNFQHAKGVNSLSQVPLKIDSVQIDLAERFAVPLMGHDGEQREIDQRTVAEDLKIARWCADHGTVWLECNCDFRGRLNPLQPFNFARGDHVRSLFRLAKGMKLGGAIDWLEIHAANCEGSTDKQPRDERRLWVSKHREDIKRIAADPFNTFDKGVFDGRGWKDADEPLQFVAACRELAAAWEDPENFITHLPIGLDGSANGLQHLSLLSSDIICADKVNLLGGEGKASIKDVYSMLINRVRQLIEDDSCSDALWWQEQFKLLDEKKLRKLLKKPCMTYGYSVTPEGAAKQIEDAYAEVFKKPTPRKFFWSRGKRIRRRPYRRFRYLAEKVLETCKKELPGATKVMNYICAVTGHCADHGRSLEWTTPSGFPVINLYQKLKTKTVQCLHGSIRVAQHRVAVGPAGIHREDALDGASANFVHSLDAAHLIKVANAAAAEGIDILTVHDCYSCLAPQVTRLLEIVLDQLADIYGSDDLLVELRRRNVSDPDDPDILPVPERGVPVVMWNEPTRVIDRRRIAMEAVKIAWYAFN
jgi:DNA-directed RNA polymerase